MGLETVMEFDKPYLLGQRVIVHGGEIVIVIRYGDHSNVWTRNLDGVVRWYAPENVKPLPGGQL
jgi:hypothetical protein